MRSSPPAKGRAHEASCSVGRGAVSVLLLRKQQGGARNPVNGGQPPSRLSPENGAALKAGRGQPPVGPVLETGHRHRGGRRRPMCQSCLCQPRRAGTHKSRGGRSVSATTGLPDAALIERPPPLMFQDMRTLFGNFIARHERRAGTGSRAPTTAHCILPRGRLYAPRSRFALPCCSYPQLGLPQVNAKSDTTAQANDRRPKRRVSRVT